MLVEDANTPAKLAALLYQQMEATEAKQADLLQATKCLIFISPHLYALDKKTGRLPTQQASKADEQEEGNVLAHLQKPEARHSSASACHHDLCEVGLGEFSFFVLQIALWMQCLRGRLFLRNLASTASCVEYPGSQTTGLIRVRRHA